MYFKFSIIKMIFLSLSALFVLAANASANSDCKRESPRIVNVERSGSSISINWHFLGSFYCYPPDFYQVRWTQGEGPGTQNQSPKIETNQADAGWTIQGVNPDALYGFIVQACVSRFAAPSKCTSWSPMAYYKPYGPNMCRNGLVWREAFPGDVVCVTPQTRDDTRADNAAGPSRRLLIGTFIGRRSCRPGFVWREAGPNDFVCVTPATRDRVVSDNSRAVANRLPDP